MSFDHHEHVSYVSDTASGLRGTIAIHNTHFVAAMGGYALTTPILTKPTH